MRRQNTNSNAWIIRGNNSTTNQAFQIGWRYNTQATGAQYTNDVEITSIPGYNSSAPKVSLMMSQLHSSGRLLTYYEDGNTTTYSNTKTTSTKLSSNNDNRIGGYNSNVDGEMAEILVYSTDHSSSNRSAIRSYFEDKWGISLP